MVRHILHSILLENCNSPRAHFWDLGFIYEVAKTMSADSCHRICSSNLIRALVI